MTSNAMLQPEPAPILACTISRDVQNFDLLIEDMEAELGESWGDLSFSDALVFLEHEDAKTLEFVAIAVDDQDETDLSIISNLITAAKAASVKVILIADDVSPIALHKLLRLGADDFIPYPLPENELHEAIERLRQEPEVQAPEVAPTTLKPTGDRNGVVLPVHGLAGGVGATTFAVNLAWELATIDKKNAPRVCILDFDLQFGSVSTFLDLPRRDAVYELLSDTETMDSESFMQALLPFNDKVHVLTAPAEILPLDIVEQSDIERLIETARSNFDYVIIDMPTTLVAWTETVLQQSLVYFGMFEMDMRSAQNMLRMIRALKAEQLPVDKMRFILNRAPKFTDIAGKSRVKRMAESLDISVEVQMPDGGKQVLQANDHGQPLGMNAAKSPLRKEISKLAASLHELNQAAETGS
ncbi:MULTISPECIES: AAA family ATPase [Halocynthiibacter]|uniref:AAA family ATPase n=1 Tax=Halocynthiibacter halioticoli TaxID=2986804 RepID=A0AAE3J025_9RHOB|nr:MULTISPECIES: AAA family ATPase [Halocynthiibacter]MCV6825273.1 AAA family ATPase [Halocynthiibacter halioticoli]MCW4058274.1 AAA family ATPase [Halocynthiibacter sp. SDUM655004]MDE0588705.1 AAA family ATPase [Halocynthiibacter sp. C4]